MRSRRLKISDGRAAYYHVISRTVLGFRLFDDGDKEVLRKMIHKVSTFCGIEVLTYCIMDNHFHILVRVPEKKPVPDQELVRRFATLYPEPTKYQLLSPEMLARQLQQDDENAELRRSMLMARMGDLSSFMKLLKQRFAIWFHKHHDTFGTLWADRFKSVLVEGRAHALSVVSAYIDLNPVRAGLVSDPKDYRFCGYAEAVAGSSTAIEGLSTVIGPERTLADYRILLFGSGAVPKEGAPAVIDRKKVLQVVEKEKGKLPTHVILQCRFRYFTDGLIIGSKNFVEEKVDQWGRGLKHPCKPHSLEKQFSIEALWMPHRPRRRAFS